MTDMQPVVVNGTPAFKTRLTVRVGSFHHSRSAIGKAPASDEFSWLMGILEGHEVDATVFSGINVCGYTNSEQLEKAFVSISPKNRLWIKEPQLEAVKAKFGDGKLAFSMSGMYCEQTPAQIEQMIAAAKQEVK